MEQLGWVGNDVWYAHGIHFTDEELDFLAETGTGVAHCPVSNMKLSSGIAKISEMLRKGVKVGLAVDGSASNDGSNLLEEIRVAFLLHRLAKSNNAPTGYDILKMATVGSASLIGRDDLGSIDKDKAADLFMIDRNQETLIAADLDPAAMLGTVGYKGKTAYTIVNGQIVVQDGRLVNIDEEELVVKANEAATQMLVS
jgi:cytosine/adenosine deaminase-related metal-dependent hydrolase